MKPLLQFLKAITPHGLVEMRRRKIEIAGTNKNKHQRASFHQQRIRKIAQATATTAAAQPTHTTDATKSEEVFDYLEKRGVPIHHITEGSIPESSLCFLGRYINSLGPSDAPLKAIHIGNFVGVSLVFVSEKLRQINRGSLTIGIDPNIPHRGINNPQAHVSALISACNLQQNTMLIAGYSRSKNISNDGVVFDDYDPVTNHTKEAACENILANLRGILSQKFNFALIDGNHEGQYLRNELRELLPLMHREGLIAIDDVDANWSEIEAVFSGISEFGLRPIECDGRIGIARLSGGSR